MQPIETVTISITRFPSHDWWKFDRWEAIIEHDGWITTARSCTWQWAVADALNRWRRATLPCTVPTNKRTATRDEIEVVAESPDCDLCGHALVLHHPFNIRMRYRRGCQVCVCNAAEPLSGE